MTLVTKSRKSLAKALADDWRDDWANRPNDVILQRLADALLASGAVVDVSTLAEPLCRHICDLLGEPRILVPGEVSALLATTLEAGDPR